MGFLTDLRTAGREFFQEAARLLPAFGANVGAALTAQAVDHQLQEITGLLAQVLFTDITRRPLGFECF
ncbi:hypothetical protein D3C79_1061740 [compost metagenome]